MSCDFLMPNACLHTCIRACFHSYQLLRLVYFIAIIQVITVFNWTNGFYCVISILSHAKLQCEQFS